jgi:2-iminoacetate synthase ThiH
MHTLTPQEFERMLREAAAEGAKQALAAVGLHDEDAGEDIIALRGLLRDWRTVRSGTLAAIGKAIGMVILAGLAFLSGKHFVVTL